VDPAVDEVAAWVVGCVLLGVLVTGEVAGEGAGVVVGGWALVVTEVVGRTEHVPEATESTGTSVVGLLAETQLIVEACVHVPSCDSHCVTAICSIAAIAASSSVVEGTASLQVCGMHKLCGRVAVTVEVLRVISSWQKLTPETSLHA
jgi:hypothetical protein